MVPLIPSDVSAIVGKCFPLVINLIKVYLVVLSLHGIWFCYVIRVWLSTKSSQVEQLEFSAPGKLEKIF